MANTALSVQALIIAKIGDIDPVTLDPTTAGTGVLAIMVPLIWDYYADYAAWGPRIQALYTERDAIKAVIAKIRVKVDVNTGQSIQLRLGQQTAALQAMLTEVNAELAEELKRRSVPARAGGVIVPITQTAPQMPPQRRPLVVDPNDPYLVGNPYFPLEDIR